jgi:putative spermidine/putrescine transport system substrate-binding protein
MLALILSACAGNAPAPDDGEPAADEGGMDASILIGSVDEQWDVILELAKEEGVVNFEMWCGNDNINTWVDSYVAPRMLEKYEIELNRICTGTPAFDRVLAGVQAGVEDPNDLLWTNGVTSANMISEGLFYGPIVWRLPNWNAYVDPNADDLTVDFGFPNRGYESPYTRTQFTMFYDSAKITDPPQNLAELKDWIIANPGRFTYPNPDVDFTGDAFLKTIFYATNSAGGNGPFLTGFDEAFMLDSAGPTWDFLNEIKPYLWREGETYPETLGELEVLFQNGEIDWIMSYGPFRGQTLINDGKVPDTVRSMVLEDGTIANANFLAIYVNAPHKAASMVFLNFMLEPETQVSWFDPANWGNLPSVSLDLIPADMAEAFANVDIGIATPPLDILAARALAEINSAYAEPLQQAWVENVLNK